MENLEDIIITEKQKTDDLKKRLNIAGMIVLTAILGWVLVYVIINQ